MLLREICGSLKLKQHSYESKQEYYLLNRLALPYGGSFQLAIIKKFGEFCFEVPQYFITESCNFWVYAAVIVNTDQYLSLCSRSTSIETYNKEYLEKIKH